MGKRSEEASRWQRKGGRPIPGRESLLTATKAACTLASRLVKWVVVELEGVNQYPSQRTSSFGLKTELSRWIGAWEIGPLSLFVRLWISSVLGIEKHTPSWDPLTFNRAYCLCRIWMFRR